MGSSKIRSIVGVFVLCVCEFDSPVEASNKTKIILGSCMIGGGTALTIHYIDAHLFGDEGDWEPIVGITLVGAGATLLIWGLLQKGHTDTTQKLEPQPNRAWEASFGIAPKKGGLAAGLSVRW